MDGIPQQQGGSTGLSVADASEPTADNEQKQYSSFALSGMAKAKGSFRT
jgi:hypothetical protein